jgi:putative tryptophan/tyrosine transport system substrate-binding protein
MVESLLSRRRLVTSCVRSVFMIGLASSCTRLISSAPTSATATRTIGFITPAPENASQGLWSALQERGWVRGDNLRVQYRQGSVQTYESQAAELVRLGVSVILTQGQAAAWAAKHASGTIPIVMVSAGDAVGSGLVASLAHPGANVTGVSYLAPEVATKRLDILRQLVPGLSRTAILWHPGIPDTADEYDSIALVAGQLGLVLLSTVAGNPISARPALRAVESAHPEALIVTNASAYRDAPAMLDILKWVAQQNIPAMYPGREWVVGGGLMFYGPQYDVLLKLAADYIDRILRGAQPSDLPVQQPTTFDFVVDATTARQQGLTFPATVAAQVTEWLQ